MKGKRKLTNRLIIGIMVSFGMFTACQQEEFAPETKIDEIANEYVPEGDPMVLGKQLENPYSVENMKKALDNLTSSGRTTENIAIETTHLYVRFLPKDTVEIAILQADTTLELFDYPLDFEIEQIGNWYHDPTIPDSLPTWQYTVVAPDYEFPGMKHETLAELFLPEEIEDDIENGRVSFDYGFLDDLEDEALRITGNWEEPIVIAGGRCRGRKCWNPSGRIRVRERERGASKAWLPVENVKVRARRWFTYRSGYTDARGNFRIDAFKRPVNYSVVFETPYAKITNWIGLQTTHNGPKSGSPWNADFNWHNESWVRATLVNAAVEYRVQYRRTGIQNPYPISYWAGGEALNKLNIRAVFKEGTGDMFVVRANRIRIYSQFTQGRGNKETDDLYRVTFHELGHQSHWKLTNWNITFSKKIIRESWADFIEHFFVIQYYPNLANDTDSQWKQINDMDDGYSAVFIDLMDNDNQLTRLGGDRPDDDVRGYTFGQIQQAVKESRKLEHVRDYLRDNYNNATEINLGDLFDFYIDIQ